MDVDVAALSDDELVLELTAWAGRVAAGESLLLKLIGEVDARERWAEIGVLSCAHWVAWKLNLKLSTARDRVRVARSLRGLPLVAAALGTAQVSYSQARAICRVATGENEQEWIDLARVLTAEQLEKVVRGVARATKDPKPDAEAPQEWLRERYDDQGYLIMTARIAPRNIPAVRARIEQAQADEQADRDRLYAQLAEQERTAAAQPAGVSAETPAAGAVPADPEDPDAPEDPQAPPYAEPYEFIEPPYPNLPPHFEIGRPRPADQRALIDQYWAELERRSAKRDAARAWQDYVQAKAAAAELPPPCTTPVDGLIRALTRPDGLTPPTVKLLIDPLSGWARASKDELLPPATLKQILKTMPGSEKKMQIRRVTHTDRRRHDLGRSNRLVSPPLRALLGQIDGERCRFPSCDRTKNLHAHHVVFWRNGGPTDLANLVLVCPRHHTLIHAEGFQLVLSPDRTLTVRTKDDIPIPHRPGQPLHHITELDLNIGPLSSDWSNDPFNLSYIVHVMLQHSR